MVWLATGHTDMRKGFASLSLQVIEKLQRELFGSRSERKARLLKQMELQLEDLEAAATPADSGDGPDGDGQIIRAQATCAQTLPRSSAARARRDCRSRELPLLRLGQVVEAGRGHHRDAGGVPRQWKVIQTSLSFPEAASGLPEKPVYEKLGRQRDKVEPTVGPNEYRRAN